jgi:hypothetical protein
LDWRTVVFVLLLYLGCLAVATYPAGFGLSDRLPGPAADPLQALTVMRWYRASLFEGRSVIHCPDLQYPVGAPLGNFSPLQFQALLYLPLSLCTSNDVLCYNLIWWINLLFTAFGTFLLAWHVLRDRVAAFFGGLLAVLSGPVQIHAIGHLELITLGWLPLFLVGWMRFVDEPGPRRFVQAAGLYLLLALSAAYFAIFALVPASLYLAAQVWGAGPGSRTTWLRERVRWLAVFVALVGPCLLLLFANQLRSHLQGYSLSRPKREFDFFGAPPWSIAVPSSWHLLGRLLPQWSGLAAYSTYEVETCSYLGLACLLLIGYALFTRPSFRRSGYWWSLLLTVAVLSWGAHYTIFGLRLSLPMDWLWRCFPPFRLIRSPARFNLCLAVVGGLIAAVGLRHLLARLPSRSWRVVVCAALTVAALADLGLAPFPGSAMPALPPCYRFLAERDPGAPFLEVPQFNSGECVDLNAAYGYWQALHRGKTTGGYSGFHNIRQDNLVYYSSPFARVAVEQPAYLADTESATYDLVTQVRFLDYAWLYLTAHRLEYIVMHKDAGSFRPPEKLHELLRHACVFEDDATAIYAASLLDTPRRTVPLCTEGWRQRVSWPRPCSGLLTASGRIAVYNPDASQPLMFTLEATALHQPRIVRLLAGDRELACWHISSDGLHVYESPAFQLAAGLSNLVLVSDGEEQPTPAEVTWEGDTHLYSLRVSRIRLAGVSGAAASAADETVAR